jgi:hypothetical protein
MSDSFHFVICSEFSSEHKPRDSVINERRPIASNSVTPESLFGSISASDRPFSFSRLASEFPFQGWFDTSLRLSDTAHRAFSLLTIVLNSDRNDQSARQNRFERCSNCTTARAQVSIKWRDERLDDRKNLPMLSHFSSKKNDVRARLEISLSMGFFYIKDYLSFTDLNMTYSDVITEFPFLPMIRSWRRSGGIIQMMNSLQLSVFSRDRNPDGIRSTREYFDI